jgi:hypothetical protein
LLAACKPDTRQAQSTVPADKAQAEQEIADSSVESHVRPADFRIEYHWSNGTVAPPYHYEYDIFIKPEGHGRIVLTCGYPGLLDYPGATYTETLDIQPTHLDEIYRFLGMNGLYTQNWREPGLVPGGGSESMIVTAQGQQIRTSSSAMFSAIRALVPEVIWTKLNGQREEFEKAHSK